MTRRLTLKRETLVSLSDTDLEGVVGAAQGITPLITQIIDPPSNTWMCTDGC